MKSKTLVRMLSLLCAAAASCTISGCGKQLPPDTLPADDYAYFFSDTAFESQAKLAKTSQGYYFMDGNFLFSWDGTSNQMTPMCKKPGCKHQKETDPTLIYRCDAYFHRNSQNLNMQTLAGSFGDHLYVLKGNPFASPTEGKEAGKLVQISADGAKQTDIVHFDHQLPAIVTVHRGYVYIVMEIYNPDGSYACSSLQRLALNRPEDDFEVIARCTLNSGTITKLYPYQDSLYWEEQYEDGMDDPATRVMRYDLTNDTVQCLAEERFVTDDAHRTTTQFYGVHQGKVCIAVNEFEYADGEWTQAVIRHFLYHPDTNALEQFSTPDQWYTPIQQIVGDESFHYLYECNFTNPGVDTAITMYDADWNPIAVIPTEEYGPYFSLLPGDDRYLFIFCNSYPTSEYPDGKICLAAYDKEKLKEGVVQKIELYDSNFSEIAPTVQWSESACMY